MPYFYQRQVQFSTLGTSASYRVPLLSLATAKTARQGPDITSYYVMTPRVHISLERLQDPTRAVCSFSSRAATLANKRKYAVL